MTARDFRLIATVLRLTGEALGEELTGEELHGAECALAGVTNGFAEALASVNDRFDRERFLAACKR